MLNDSGILYVTDQKRWIQLDAESVPVVENVKLSEKNPEVGDTGV